jgi:hypothetical protein
MLTYSVTIDKTSNSDIFLKLMNELKFVVLVKPEIESDAITALELALPGRKANDDLLPSIFELSEESVTLSEKTPKKRILISLNHATEKP